MIDSRTLAANLRGPGVAIMARQRWSALPLGKDVSFVDEVDLATLRRAHPEWRTLPLAPVSKAEPPLALASFGDASLGFLAAFALGDSLAHLNQLFATAGRALTAGGALLLSIPDQRYAGASDDHARKLFLSLDQIEAELKLRTSEAQWTGGRLVYMIGKFLADRSLPFEIELAGRIGSEALVVLRATGPGRYRTGDLLEFASGIYVVDGRFVRHVQSLAALAPLRLGGRSIWPIDEHEMAGLVIGPAARLQDVGGLIERRDAAA